VPSLGWRGLERRAVGASPDWPIDGIEAFNASLWLAYNNRLAAKLAAQLGVNSFGGSDSHHLATIGRGYTLFPGRTAADLRAAIMRREVQAGGSFWGWPAVAQIARLQLWRIAGNLVRVVRRAPEHGNA
jgi:predicted metal-dependent phosphoesterase TrpH